MIKFFTQFNTAMTALFLEVGEAGMNQLSSNEITQLLIDWSDVDNAALDELMPLFYNEHHNPAIYHRVNQPAGHTRQATTPVNEAYLRLFDSSRVNWQNRSQFFAISAQPRRRVLVDFARAKSSLKRGGQIQKVEPNGAFTVNNNSEIILISLDVAFQMLANLNPRPRQVVELRHFGGLREEEFDEVLKISIRSVRRDQTRLKNRKSLALPGVKR